MVKEISRQHDAHPADARRNARLVTVFKIARIETAAGGALCVVRNLSATGSKIETAAPLAADDRIIVEFSSDFVRAATVIWSAAGFAGLQFDRPVDVADILTGGSAATDGPAARAPRFDLALPAQVAAGDGGSVHATLENISIAGAALTLAAAADVEAGDLIRVAVDGLGEMGGEIRWKRGAAIGVRFHAPIPFRRLASRLAGTPLDTRPAPATAD